MCPHISKGIIILHPLVTALERERESRNSVRERQLCSGDNGYVTWRSPSYPFLSCMKKIATIGQRLVYSIFPHTETSLVHICAASDELLSKQMR